MPFIPLIAGGLAAGGAAASGKKARKKAQQAVDQQGAIQRESLGLSKEQLALGKTAFLPARDYWLALMGGGQPARDAVGPMAAEVKFAHEAGRRSIEENLPRGGERNLAMAQSQTAQDRDTSRLHAGVQPLAAQNLAQLSSAATGAGVGLIPPAQIGASLAYQSNQNQLNQQGASGIGRFLYNVMNGKSSGGPGAGSTPPFIGGKS